MTNEKRSYQVTYEKIKSCLLELGFPGADETFKEDSAKFITGIQEDDITMYIEIICYESLVHIRVSPDLIFEMQDTVRFYQFINYINFRIMDIGHMSVNQPDGEIFLQTFVDFADQLFDRQQVLHTMQRVSIQGLELFRFLKDMTDEDQCPLQMLHDFIEEKRNTMTWDLKKIQ